MGWDGTGRDGTSQGADAGCAHFSRFFFKNFTKTETMIRFFCVIVLLIASNAALDEEPPCWHLIRSSVRDDQENDNTKESNHCVGFGKVLENRNLGNVLLLARSGCEI